MLSACGPALRLCSLFVIVVALGCEGSTPTAPTTPTAPSTQPPPTPQASLTSVTLAAANVDGGSGVSGTVTLSAAAAATGFPVTLSSSTAAAALPATMTIAGGATTGTFTVTTAVVDFFQTATITATAGDVSRTATLEIQPAPGDGPIASFTAASRDLIGGANTQGTVALLAPAPAGGVEFTLASSDAVVVVPESLTIPEGAASGAFRIDTARVTSGREVTITITMAAKATVKGVGRTAAAGGGSATLLIRLVPEPDAPTLTSVSPATGVQGATVAATLTGTSFIADASITVGGAGVTVSDVTITSESSMQARFSIAADAAPGGRDVTVTTSAGTSDVRTFTITPPSPTLTAISPATGTTLGGTVTTLTGTNLTGTTGVTFGGTAATTVTVVNATTVTATTPAHAAGAVDVVITTPGGSATLSGGYTYTTPPPTLTAIAPATGTMPGGTVTTLTGTNLTGTTGVTFGGTAATAVTVVNATTVTATTPAHAVGVVDVVITTPGGSATLAGGYSYTGPVLTAIDVTSGSASGGRGVTLTGTTLTGATGVTFGGVAATSVNVVNATTVTAVTPEHAAGAVNVVITTPAGSSTLTNGYTYEATAAGQPAHGGVIAALTGGLNNLIAAIVDNSAGVEWGDFGTAIGGGAQSLTDGSANTAAIVAFLGNNGGTNYAAQVCSAHEVDSQGNTPCQPGDACYNDWFLPASVQLLALFANRVAIGGFAVGHYFSSTEHSALAATRALSASFSDGTLSFRLKDDLSRVRCVRAFTPGGG